MLKQVTPILLIAAVTACSSPIDRRQANGNDDYALLEPQPRLVIPEGLNEPKYSTEYEIPTVSNKVDTNLVGKKLDIRPPLQVLPMAEGTHVEESSDSIKIVVESIDNDVDLKQELFTILTEYLNSKSIKMVKEDYDAGIIETDWIENQELIDSTMWGSDEIYTVRQRYRFTLNVRPHGRTGNLAIELAEHEESFDGKDQDIVLSGEDKRRYTVDMLNNTITYMSVKRAKMLKAKRLRESLGIDVELVKAQPAGEGETAEVSYWLAQAPYSRTWDRLRIVLPEMGFEIVDMDSNKGLYYINVNDDSGFWSSLWNEKKLPVEEGSYRLRVEEDELDSNQSRIYLNDMADEPVGNDVVEAVYEGLSELMKEDRKLK
ncbi:outer membrane protein assembly factor BamC [Shewanella psychrotolerans]|uniref:outer membrane protein assembly factor BamC n=1 Tax=Shewanella psychrotolerans TaxID=2864206 RepID=UPI001C655DF8|nr:outer membrane protein assembly factor BamC [Shewanella psychrotolerans]QYJ99959.1 outer membrane protein assembly factor BamC [Shewanella psychrotolerans]